MEGGERIDMAFSHLFKNPAYTDAATLPLTLLTCQPLDHKSNSCPGDKNGIAVPFLNIVL